MPLWLQMRTHLTRCVDSNPGPPQDLCRRCFLVLCLKNGHANLGVAVIAVGFSCLARLLPLLEGTDELEPSLFSRERLVLPLSSPKDWLDDAPADEAMDGGDPAPARMPMPG